MRTLLLDCDSLVYAAAKAHEYEICWSDDLWTLHARLNPAIDQLNETVEDLKEKLEADDVVMALSDYRNPWRKIVMPSYKSNRKDVRKPVIFQPLRDYVHETWTTYQREGLEGDDILGLLATNPVVIAGEKIIVSLDKDMKTVPGKHFNMQKEVEFERSLDDADLYHFTQILTGDSTDGYGGCPGVGPKGAEKLLAPSLAGKENGNPIFNRAQAWEIIVKAYAKAGLGEEEAIRMGRVSRILRHGDYHYDEKRVILWNPPTSSTQR